MIQACAPLEADGDGYTVVVVYTRKTEGKAMNGGGTVEDMII
jgi:hypothetical protein